MSHVPAPADQVTEVDRHDHQVLAAGAISTFVQDEFSLTVDGHTETMRRQYMGHPGAVAIIAIDADDRVACVHQYRHPAGMTMVEPPAGLLDRPDEDPWAAARRELAEEAELAADHWAVLADVALSPGGSMEQIRVFLATGLQPTARPEGFVLEGEERLMGLAWHHLDDLVAGILGGRLSSPSLIAGVLAVKAARSSGTTLLPPDSPWPARAAQRPRLVELLDELARRE
ncbi:NUDIX domain-containing protein [Aestuariimicrobium ganziense]|uniref:NUDIX domain-containing protein n=1 Tax=Aestuariimicrobium ganziense TaxID=2773677 RepID=UPI0019429349|nr:NUDIX hydrolase [Aestuariimicrobium ganziense]